MIGFNHDKMFHSKNMCFWELQDQSFGRQKSAFHAGIKKSSNEFHVTPGKGKIATTQF